MSEEKIIDLDLSETGRKSIRIDGDNNRILKINTSDLSVISRLKSAEERMEGLVRVAAEKLVNADGNMDIVGNSLKEADEEMRACLDYVFNADVSAVCAPEGTMFDSYNGKYKFEIIMEALFGLYEDNLSIEYRKMASRIKSRTEKYTGK